jgi:hypothetical protein
VVLLNERSQLLINHLTSIVEDIASTYADEKIDEKLWSIDSQLLKDSLIKKLPTINEAQTINTISDALFDTVLENFQTN